MYCMACLWLIKSPFVMLTDLGLELLCMTFVFVQYPSYTNTLDEFELFADHITDPRAQNVKMLHFHVWLDLDHTLTLVLKRSAWISCISMGAFERHLMVSIRHFVSESGGWGGRFCAPAPNHWHSTETPLDIGLKALILALAGGGLMQSPPPPPIEIAAEPLGRSRWNLA